MKKIPLNNTKVVVIGDGVAGCSAAYYLAKLESVSLIYIYPMMGQFDKLLLYGWDNIPSALGCAYNLARLE